MTDDEKTKLMDEAVEAAPATTDLLFRVEPKDTSTIR
jgi:hypothetical protein